MCAKQFEQSANCPNKLWTDKYTPQKLDDVIGHTKSIGEIQKWAANWEKGKRQKPLLIHGATGVGKTATVLALVKEHGWDLLELNASDLRNAEKIQRTAGHASASKTFSGNLRLILFDEVDGLYRKDRGGSGAIYKILKEAQCPIILTANDIWDQKLASIRNSCERIQMKKVHYATIAKYLVMIAKEEEVDVDKDILLKVSRNCSGDVRSAINDLQFLTQGVEKIDESDLEILGERDRTESIFNAIRTILKTKDFTKSRDALKNLEENPDFIMKWIDENVPAEYKRPEDLHRAYEYISKADIYLGRVYRRQQYQFWRYASDMMGPGVSLSKEETYRGFIRYSFPGFIRYLSKAKPERAMRKNIALKIGKRCHTSSSIAIQDYLPMFSELMKNQAEAAKLTAQFDFTEKELEFFKVKNPEKLIEKAEKLKAELREKIMKSKRQKGLVFN